MQDALGSVVCGYMGGGRTKRGEGGTWPADVDLLGVLCSGVQTAAMQTSGQCCTSTTDLMCACGRVTTTARPVTPRPKLVP